MSNNRVLKLSSLLQEVGDLPLPLVITLPENYYSLGVLKSPGEPIKRPRWSLKGACLQSVADLKFSAALIADAILGTSGLCGLLQVLNTGSVPLSSMPLFIHPCKNLSVWKLVKLWSEVSKLASEGHDKGIIRLNFKHDFVWNCVCR